MQKQQNESAQEQASATTLANPVGNAGKWHPYQSKGKARQSLVNKSDPYQVLLRAPPLSCCNSC